MMTLNVLGLRSREKTLSAEADDTQTSVDSDLSSAVTSSMIETEACDSGKDIVKQVFLPPHLQKVQIDLEDGKLLKVPILHSTSLLYCNSVPLYCTVIQYLSIVL